MKPYFKKKKFTSKEKYTKTSCSSWLVVNRLSAQCPVERTMEQSVREGCSYGHDAPASQHSAGGNYCRARVYGHPQLHNKCKASLVYKKRLKKTKT